MFNPKNLGTIFQFVMYCKQTCQPFKNPMSISFNFMVLEFR